MFNLLKRLLLVGLLVSLMSYGVAAQETITLKVAVPSFFKDLIEDELVEQYEALNPGVRVEIVATNANLFNNPSGSVENFLDTVESYVTQADVVAITSDQLTIEATRAGYFLNLAPLISTDPRFDESDFFPVMLNSFRWDNGTWALPISADVITVIYNKAAFDNAGVLYPSPAWSLNDLEAAIRDLTQYDETGSVSVPALLNFSGTYHLMHSLIGGVSLTDTIVQPALPRLDLPELQPLLTQWVDLANEGLLEGPDTNSLNLDVPMLIGQSILGLSGQFGGEREITLLPGGRAGILVNGAAVSAGTRYPEAAYQLANYITTNAELANAFFGVSPARRSLVGIETEGPLSLFTNVPENLRPVIENALNNAISAADARFAPYIDSAIQQMRTQGFDAQAALQQAEQQAITRLQTAQSRSNTLTIAVATPRPAANLGAGEITLNFGISSFFPQLPNQDRWDQLAQSFATADPEVGEVILDVKLPFPSLSLAGLAEDYDCFYVPNNLVKGADLTLIRSLDPLMASDFNFDRNDIAGDALNQVRRDNQIWALPLNIQPLVLWYEPTIFQQYGARTPFEGWSVSDFENILRTLKIDAQDAIPFNARNGDSSHLLSLVAAYGGLPLDYRTSPVTINFTDPATVEAIRQVLNLAKDGYIQYQPLASPGGSFAFGRPENIAIYSQLLNQLAFLGTDSSEPSPYRLSTFPQGTQYSAVSYDLGTAYISASTPAIEPCYRFMTAIANTPELFENVMPVRRSHINNPNLAVTQGAEAAEFYGAMDRLMQQPNTVLLPSTFQAATDLTAIGDLLITVWLGRAFDRYVLEDADLLVELEDAQLYASSYQGCAANVPPATASDNIINYLQRYIDCAVQVDSSIGDLFPQFRRQ